MTQQEEQGQEAVEQEPRQRSVRDILQDWDRSGGPKSSLYYRLLEISLTEPVSKGSAKS